MIGRTLGHYRLVRSLGQGGMGEVWAAEDTKLGRQVALKLLPDDMAGDAETLARFEREAKAIAALDHPNIVTIHSIEQADGAHFLTMQLVDGQTVADILDGAAGHGLSLGEFFAIAAPLADAVSAAHERGIAHRDLKPSNVMVTADGRVLVLDFGLAKIQPTGGDDEKTVGPAEVLTGEGKVLGTVAYMSPEQAEGKTVDERTDLFSLGVMLYELSTGIRPFVGDTQMSILTAILRDTPEPVSEINDTLPRQLGRIIRHCLEKDPERRMQSAKDLRNELEDLRREIDADSGGVTPATMTSGDAAMTSGPAPPRTEQSSAPSGRAWRRWALAAGMVAVLSLAVVWGIQWQAENARVGEIVATLESLAVAGDLDALHSSLASSGLGVDDPRLSPTIRAATGTLTVSSTPAAQSAWLARVTPLDSFAERPAMPSPLPLSESPLVAGEYLLRLDADGHESLTRLVVIDAGESVRIQGRLVLADPERQGMVHVAGGPSPLDESTTVSEFFIDAYEVTNADYLEFVGAGGYRDEALWPSELLIEGERLGRVEAIRAFVDRTGIPGPRGWSGGRFAEGNDGHPVAGVSWYEAAAYARWRGKQLPDSHQWWRAAVGDGGRVLPWGNDVRSVAARANFELSGTTPVGSLPLGVSPHGAFDMAGNVREWLAADDDDARLVTGGSWRDPTYMFDPSAMESFAPDYARDSIGFRLVATRDSAQ